MPSGSRCWRGSPPAWGGGAIPKNFLKNKGLPTYLCCFPDQIYSNSYLVELLIFECFVQIKAHTWSILSGCYRSYHIPGLNCRA